MALAALRATREAEARQGWQRLPCIVGVPLPGERLGRKVFDGSKETAVFPGDLPADPTELALAAQPDAVHFLRFRPPRVDLDAAVRGGARAAAHPARPGDGFPAGRQARMSGAPEPRKPRVFEPDDPALVSEPPPDTEAGMNAGAPPAANAPLARPTLADIGERGLRWGTLLAGALAGAALLGMAAWFARLVSAALVRDDWVGTFTLSLLLVAAFAALMIVLREVIGFSRLARLNRLKADIAAALDHRSRQQARAQGRQAPRRTSTRAARARLEHQALPRPRPRRA